MENPICFSSYFVNKQNVRSVSHVINVKLLTKSEEYLLSVVENDLLCELSSEFSNILLTLKSNVILKGKQDFRNYFPKNENCEINRKSHIEAVLKEKVFSGCWEALCETVPKILFGCQHNMKIFKDLVRVVVYSMKNQHIFLSKHIIKWNMNVHPWNLLSTGSVKQVISKTLCWILKNILPAIICLNFFVTTCKIDTDENKLFFFWKNQWQSFYDRSISNMINSKVISKCEQSYTSKKMKTKYSPQERLNLKNVKRGIPKLHLVLKPGNNYRPIVRVRSKNDALTCSEKSKIKDRLNFLKTLTGKLQEKVETKFASFYLGWLKCEQPKLYFVKTDLSNAFGSINREKLLKILSAKHADFQKSPQPLYLKKKIAHIYKEMISELHKPLLVRAGSTVYEWRQGLVQGYKYSPALSELYYTHMDELYFSDHWKKHDSKLKLFIRVVDDYLYITDSLEDAQSFLTSVLSYRNVNYDKTVVNFTHPSIKIRDEITFLGYSYNTKNLQVNRASNIYTGQMCYKISFSNAISDISRFLENRIGQSGIQINNHLFNFNYNTEEVIWRHIFLTLCLSANKFCTILSIICSETEIPKYIDLYKKRVTVRLCNSMIETLKKNKPKDVLFVYCINHFRYLSFKALSLCANQTTKCNVLLPLVNIELTKTNCIFGKFREHASRIDKYGKMLCPAVKEVCRRTDLRQTMKQFEVLPHGFECFNRNRFLHDL